MAVEHTRRFQSTTFQPYPLGQAIAIFGVNITDRIHLLNAYWFGRIVYFSLLLGIFVVALNGLSRWIVLNGATPITSTMIPGLAAIAIGALVASIITEGSRKRGNWATFGILPGRFAMREITIGAVFAAVMLSVTAACAWLSGATFVTAFYTIDGAWVANICAILALGAAAEELLFRGIVFQAVMERFGAGFATFGSSAIFALAHYGNPHISPIASVNIFLAGMLMATLYVVTRSLWLPTAFHFCWNAGQHFFLGSPVSGIDWGAALIRILPPEDTKSYSTLLGGAFGIEEGAIAGITLVIAIGAAAHPFVAKISPYLASRQFRRQYEESALRFTYSMRRAQNKKVIENRT